MKKSSQPPTTSKAEADDLDQFIASINKKPPQHHGTKVRFNWTSRKRK